MLWTPELGGYFEDYFDEITRLRGIGADPWHPVPVTRALDTVCRQARGAELEAQFRANVILGDAPTGVEGSRRLFCAALKEADRLPAGGILWVECFQPHEPWINLKCDPWGIPGYFRYGRVGLEVGKDEVTAQRHLYARRLVEIDTSLLDFASELRGTDFEILILSDHGIYLGDYGLFGKPKNEPLLPPVARLVCRTTLSVPHGTIGWVQPHELASLLLQKDGNAEVDAHADASLTRGKRFRVSGRNSPETNCIQVLCEEGICTFWRRPTDRCLLPWDGLDPGRDWRDNICREHPVLDEAALFVRSLFSGRERIEEFRI